MTIRQQCAECDQGFDYQHCMGGDCGHGPMFAVVMGGWDIIDKDGTVIKPSWSVDICSPKCLVKWYKKKYGKEIWEE